MKLSRKKYFLVLLLTLYLVTSVYIEGDLPRGANFSGKGEEIKFIFICIRIDVENAWCLSLLVHRLYVILLFFLNSCSFQKQLDQSGLVQYMQRNGNDTSLINIHSAANTLGKI